MLLEEGVCYDQCVLLAKLLAFARLHSVLQGQTCLLTPGVSCLFHDPADVGNLISGSSAFSKTSLNMGKLMVHILLKPSLENFEHDFASV